MMMISPSSVIALSSVFGLVALPLLLPAGSLAHSSLDRPIVHSVNLNSVGTLGQALLRFEGEKL